MRPPGAAQKHQGADHGEHAEHEADDGSGTGPGPEVPGDESSAKGTEHEPDDLRAHVLDHARPVQPHGSGDVALETGHADAHVPRISQILKQCCQAADHQPDENDAFS